MEIEDQATRNAAALTQTINLVSEFVTKRVMEYPGFLEWRKSKLKIVLGWEDLRSIGSKNRPDDFQFDDEFMRYYEAVHSWIRLYSTGQAAKDCEYYFRRYPFWNLPVTREAHLRHICEMWFSRIYEYKERLKTCLNSINAALPETQLDAGNIIKRFARAFENEIRARNQIHHHRQFEDLMLEKIALTQMMSLPIGEAGDEIRLGWRLEHEHAYRQTQKEWASRVKRRGLLIDSYTGTIGNFIVDHMPWLSGDPQRASKA